MEGIIVLNIPSYGGGVNLWGAQDDEKGERQDAHSLSKQGVLTNSTLEDIPYNKVASYPEVRDDDDDDDDAGYVSNDSDDTTDQAHPSIQDKKLEASLIRGLLSHALCRLQQLLILEDAN
eukprot:5047778-Amphidinium_carterae.1